MPTLYANSTRMPTGTRHTEVQSSPEPFVTKRLRLFSPGATFPAPARIELDPETQTAIRYNAAGNVIEMMPEHGTSTSSETSAVTSPDGANGNTDTSKDQSGDQ